MEADSLTLPRQISRVPVAAWETQKLQAGCLPTLEAIHKIGILHNLK